MNNINFEGLGHGADLQSAIPLEFERLSPSLGAIVHRLDLASPLPEAVIEAIRAGLDEYQVLFFRNQSLTPAQQRDFAARFGALHVHPVYPHEETVPEIVILEDGESRKSQQNKWQADVTFTETPPFGAVLYADDVPPSGGDTIWASCYAAFEALSGPMQAFLSGLQAVHDFPRDVSPDQFRSYGRDGRQNAADASRRPALHPVVRTNVKTGRRGLFVNRSFTSRINGLTREESDALLGFLFRHLEHPEFQVRFRWTQGAVAFWDCRFAQHYTVSDYYPQHRRVRRATILGDRPL